LTSEIKQLHDEVRKMRRDLEEIKVMLVPEATPTKEEIKAIEQGRKEFARGEFVDWKAVKKKRAVS
jgi:vacuolar-type H+-ATPase subunit D/Vma8